MTSTELLDRDTLLLSNVLELGALLLVLALLLLLLELLFFFKEIVKKIFGLLFGLVTEARLETIEGP